MKQKTKKRILSLSLTDILTFLIALYAVTVVVCNIFEMKTIGTSTVAIAGGGIFLSWISFMIMDVLTEVWDRHLATKVFTFAAIINIVITLIAQLIIFLPGTYPDQNNAFSLIFSNGPRTIFASTLAFWIGNFVNVFSMDKMKIKAKLEGKDNGWWFAFRAIVSSILGQLFDNFLFVTLAFAPIGISVFEMTWMDILTSVLIGTTLEVLVESFFVPIVTRPVSLLLIHKKRGGEDVSLSNGN